MQIDKEPFCNFRKPSSTSTNTTHFYDLGQVTYWLSALTFFFVNYMLLFGYEVSPKGPCTKGWSPAGGVILELLETQGGGPSWRKRVTGGRSLEAGSSSWLSSLPLLPGTLEVKNLLHHMLQPPWCCAQAQESCNQRLKPLKLWAMNQNQSFLLKLFMSNIVSQRWKV
jgi:hypothetical protein